MTFAKLHDSVLEDQRLSKSAKEVYARISRRCINTEAWTGTQSELARAMNIDVRHVRRLVAQLVKGRHLYIQRRGRGNPSVYMTGQACKMSYHNSKYDRTKMSYHNADDRTKMSYHNSSKKSASSSPVISSQNRVSPYIYLKHISQQRRLEGGDARGGNRWPETAAAKFEKLIGQPPDPAFTSLKPEIALDNLELLEYKLARGAKIDHRAGWLAEAIRSNYAGQDHKQFKTSRQRAAEATSATNTQLAKRREVEAWERKLVDDQAFNQWAREIFTALDAGLKSRLEQAARETMGINIPRDPKLQVRAISFTTWGIFIELLKGNEVKHGLSPDILKPYEKMINQRFGTGHGTRPPPM
jgi:hypothetical protein